MAEKEEEPQKMNHIEMTHICAGCDKDDCETACKNGTCKLIQKP